MEKQVQAGSSKEEERKEKEKEADDLVDPLNELEHLSIYSGESFPEQKQSPRKNLMSRNTSLLEKSERENTFPVNLHKLRMLTSVDDIKSLRFWKAVAAEFVGTFILVLVGCGSCIQNWSSGNYITLRINDTDVNLINNYSSADIVQIALAFGLSVATVICIIGHVSGGHVNPAVTSAMLITRRISLARAFLFIVIQLLGAMVGAGILRLVTPNERQEALGCTMLGPGVGGFMGAGVELCITFVLVLTVFAACDKQRKDLGGSFPLTIGLSVTMCHLFAIRFTGSSMNTARSFGPAVVMGIWKDHWVYWVGPILGGVLAGLTYDNVFSMNASLQKCRAFFLASQYDNENYKARKAKIRIIEEDLEEGEETKGEETRLAPIAEK
ncbi:hypothetical protein ACJMK2_009184 [Sinanodonta woodiana]|uniref:Uncharacterized protein n=1 Tax=Sinanodonta woodiana TaxID=1069815 RepID=A0ABD3VBG6_SINWO